uniref:Uncharacterized protein n=1 Tax=Arundo donax TaxID=35708 RepID=A0A0A8Z0K5_ARUDO
MKFALLLMHDFKNSNHHPITKSLQWNKQQFFL